ncbi:hypothetical protein PMAYCL1PPCAC_18915, partial [Pristionchus mayeri]
LLLLFSRIADASEATLTGVIGYTSDQLSHMDWFTPRESQGGCRWYGTSPFCNGQCPDGYQQIRESNGRNSNWWMSGFNVPDDSYGQPCTTILGGFFKKRYCCMADPSDCTWRGVWQRASSTAVQYCRFINDGSRCGQLECTINTFSERGSFTVAIRGERCNIVKKDGISGNAMCGIVEWHKDNADGSKSPVDSWFKL